jgi:ketosteroid isomerase-like protein
MHTTRPLLVGALTLALVGGPSAAGVAQHDEPACADLVAATEANETANLDAFFAGDLDAIMATYTEDAIFEDQTFGDYREGNVSVRGMVGAAIRLTDADATEVLDRFVSADGSRAVVVERWIGTNYQGVPFDLPIVAIHEYRDGRIAKESIYYAARDAYDQLWQSPSTE